MNSALKKHILKCQIHKNNKVLYMKIKDIQENRSIFYCEICVCKDQSFKPFNYINLKQVFEISRNTIVFHWPPINDVELEQQMIEIADKTDTFSEILENKINLFFDELKAEFLNLLYKCQKKMLNQSQELAIFNRQIKNEYQEISQLDSLRQILSNFSLSQADQEKQCRNLILDFQKKRSQVTSQLQRIFNNQQELQQKINSNTPLLLKTQILYLLDQITFFDSTEKEDEDSRSVKSNQLQIQNQQIDILPKIEFIKSDFNHDYSNELISIKNKENNQIQLSSTQNQQGYFYSNILLDKNKMYRFKLSIKNSHSIQSKYFGIGLVRDQQKDSNCYKDSLCCILQYDLQESCFKINTSYSSIKNIVEGNFEGLTSDLNLELAVCLIEEILEVTVNQTHKSVIVDQCKSNLINYKNLRVFIYLQQQIEATLLQVIELTES